MRQRKRAKKGDILLFFDFAKKGDILLFFDFGDVVR